jgi:imidazolonepropionase-like amidohydrolase
MSTRYYTTILILIINAIQIQTSQAQTALTQMNPARPVNPPTYIVHASLVDVGSQKILPDYTIVIINDTITEVGPSKKIKPKDGANIIDATGKWVMPGLVDAHVHFFQTGGLNTRPDAIDLRKYYPYEKELSWYKNNMEEQLKRYLSCGITTVIDDGATLGLLKQRDSFATKNYAPRILMAGPLISTAYAPKPFDMLNDPDKPFYTVNTPADAVKMTEKQYSYQPDFIKIWYIVVNPDTRKGAEDNLPMVKATIETAHAHHFKVAVHATERVTAQLAVETGADFLVHDIEDEVIDDSFIQLLKSHGVPLCPTLTVMSGYAGTFSQSYTPTAEDIAKGDPEQLASLQELRYLPDSTISKRYLMLSKMIAKREARQDSIRDVNLKKMADAGVTIVTGTDAGNIGTLHASSYFKELRAMQHAGLSNWQIITASTINGAKVLGKENEFGTITKGKTADLLILNANPADNLANLEKIDQILHRGTSFSPDSLIDATPLEIIQRQDNAYNAHDLETFLSFYADTAVLYNMKGKLIARGKDDMRKTYDFLNRAPIHVTIANRAIMNNKVIDHELVFINGQKVGEGVAIYYITGKKISKVYFLEDRDQ